MSTFFKPAIKAFRQNDVTGYKGLAAGADAKLAAEQSTQAWASLRDSTSKVYTQNFDSPFKVLSAEAVKALESINPSRLAAAFSVRGGARFDNKANGYTPEVFNTEPQQQPEAGISHTI